MRTKGSLSPDLSINLNGEIHEIFEWDNVSPPLLCLEAGFCDGSSHCSKIARREQSPRVTVIHKLFAGGYQKCLPYLDAVSNLCHDGLNGTFIFLSGWMNLFKFKLAYITPHHNNVAPNLAC
jgi:hypothetical protein